MKFNEKTLTAMFPILVYLSQAYLYSNSKLIDCKINLNVGCKINLNVDCKINLNVKVDCKINLNVEELVSIQDLQFGRSQFN